MHRPGGMRRPTWFGSVVAVICASAGLVRAAEPLELNLRLRERVGSEGDHFVVRHQAAAWAPEKTAIVVCDMWDKHWCAASTARVAEMAPRMNKVLRAARERGVLIIHCPSDTMEFYKGTPQRQLAQQAPPVPTKRPLERWCRLDGEREPPLPIDDSDNGCDSGDSPGSPWRRQIETLEILEGDAVTDSAEAFYLMKQRGITNVIVMGVHTNMCVLGRPFSIRQMVYQGQNVVLMRDLTDTMYNPARSPFVSHFTGTDLVVEHIEKYWCPTITSADLLGGEPFRFQEDTRPTIAIVASENEYKTESTLPRYFVEHLGKKYRAVYVFADPSDEHRLAGLEQLSQADMLLLSMRRRTLPEAQLKAIRELVASGKPIVAIRTSSHAFVQRDGTVPDGRAAWPEFDRDVLGGNYTGHHANSAADAPRTIVERAAIGAAAAPKERQADFAILQGVSEEPFPVRSWLYKTRPLSSSAVPLLWGRVGDSEREPVAWTNLRGKQRVFYTSLGHPDDFQQQDFQVLLRNGIDWAAAGLPSFKR